MLIKGAVKPSFVLNRKEVLNINRLDNIILKAQNLKKYNELKPCIAFIDVGKWVTILTVRLWNGVQGGKMKDVFSLCSIEQEALNKLYEQYNFSKNIPIIIDDIGGVVYGSFKT